MILARLVRSKSFWAVAEARAPHTGPEPGYPEDSTADIAENQHPPPTQRDGHASMLYHRIRAGSRSEEGRQNP